MAKGTRQTPTWAISRIKGTPAVVLGHVEAPDAESAIEEAMQRFELKERVRERLAARRVKQAHKVTECVDCQHRHGGTRPAARVAPVTLATAKKGPTIRPG
jgi:hypothetical protein